MKKIWKYPIKDTGTTEWKMPKGAKILSVQNQRGCISMWVEVDFSENEYESRSFVLIPTGLIAYDATNKTYLATVQMHDGYTVMHVFECRKESVSTPDCKNNLTTAQ